MDSAIAQPSRPSILYVDRSSSDPRACEARLSVAAALGQHYEVEARCDLGRWALDRLRSALATRPFDAMVTHVPNDPGKPSYGESLSVLRDINKLVGIPVIAYTGATGFVLALMEVDRIVLKSRDCREDARTIHSHLEHLLRNRREEIDPPPPVLVKGQGRTSVEAFVNRAGGLGLRGTCALCEECKKYARWVKARRLDADAETPAVDCKNVFEVLLLAAGEGSRVLISVEGEDAEAEEIARHVYGVLTSH